METDTHPQASNNIFDNLEDEADSSVDEEGAESPYAEVERGVDQGQFGSGINKRERNAVFRQTRKAKAEGSKTEPTEKKVQNFTLKERRLQRELTRYVHYHRRCCHASPQALSLLHTVSNIKKIVIPDQIP